MGEQKKTSFEKNNQTISRSPSLTYSQLTLWILCLAALAVGAKNFEMGLSVDAPFYATVARNIARTGELFNLHGSVPEYRPFIYHPPLGLWLLAGVFKVLPAADWSARLLGILFYFLFIGVYFLFVRKKTNEKVAVLSVLLLWSWSRFSNFFSNVYLDPGTLFFGTVAIALFDLSLEKRKKTLSFVSGISLGLALLYKGMAVAGFFPILLVSFVASYLSIYREKKSTKILWQLVLIFLLGALFVVVPFLMALFQSSVPDYLSRYWDYQMVSRIRPAWNIKQLVNGLFWSKLLIDTNYLLPLCLLIFRKKNSSSLCIPLVAAVSFGGLLLFSNLVGIQYWLYLLPWLAWLISDSLVSWLPVSSLKLVRFSSFLAMTALVIIHLVPLNIHGCQPTEDELEIAKLSKQRKIDRMILDSTPYRVDVTATSRFAWYGDLEVFYPTENPLDAPAAETSMAYVHINNDENRKQQLLAKGWCVERTFGVRTIWLKCPVH